ncbi:hypothetical protein [Thioclava nitratireducens]|uniref:8-oxoguanine DNA glycosylase OGG fold protein n=1 Tax=Thioclava nitratireducens TaxID=1915078 RepID=UPI00315CAAE2
MPILVHDGSLRLVKLDIQPQEIPALLQAHRTKWEPPQRLEARGEALIAADFPSDEAVQFAYDVIRWGKGHRFVDRFKTQNSPDSVSRALRQSVKLADRGNVAEGVEEIRKLSWISQSFASKIVRFLRPNAAVILDSVIRNALGYAETKDGYNAFLRDCEEMLAAVADDYPQLRVCDIEAAIFAKLQGY